MDRWNARRLRPGELIWKKEPAMPVANVNGKIEGPLPSEAAERKKFPIGTGVLDYFPDALLAVAEVSRIGNDQHNPGQPLHWARNKSTDEADTMLRHFIERGTRDTDGARHTAKMVWRALAILQKEIEAEKTPGYVSRGSRA